MELLFILMVESNIRMVAGYPDGKLIKADGTIYPDGRIDAPKKVLKKLART